MANWAFSGPPNSTSGHTSYPNNFVYTDGYGFPTGNLGLNGNRPIYVGGIYAGYASGAGGAAAQIYYRGVLIGGGYTYADSGGTFQFRIFYVNGTLYFGRVTGNGLVTRDNADGGVYSGGLSGSFDYATVPTTCTWSSVTRTGRSMTVVFGGPASNGDSAISYYGVERSENGGAWQDGRVNYNGVETFNNLTPNSSQVFRVYAVNGVGAGQAVNTGSYLVPAGGKKFDGTTFNSTTIAKRFTDPTTAVDLSIARRFNGTSWVDLS